MKKGSKLQVIEYKDLGFWQDQPNKFCSNHFGPRKDSWCHCWECRNKTARWQSWRAAHYTETYEQRQIRTACLNVVTSQGEYLTCDESDLVLERFRKQFTNHHPKAGYLLVLDRSINGRPHWHGLTVGIEDDDVKQAWSSACNGLEAWANVGPIGTTVRRTLDYAYKVNGIYKGKPVPVPRAGVKVVHERNYFQINKSLIEKELASQQKHTERKNARWTPDEEQVWEDLESVITRYKKGI